MRHNFLVIFSLFLLIACNKTAAPEPNIHGPPSAPDITENIVTLDALKDGTYCFSKELNKDVTDVQLNIVGDVVTGKMNWLPYEKDSARGTLQGFKNKAGELELLYDYMIEGIQQTETKIMKIEAGKLHLKTGELLDPKNDGNLVYKDVSQAKFSEILEKVDCKN